MLSVFFFGCVCVEQQEMEVLQVFVANVLIIGVSALILRQTLPKFTTFRPWYKEWLRQHVRMARADGKGRWRRPKTLDLVFFYYFFVLFVSSLSLLYLRFDTHALFFFFFFFWVQLRREHQKKKAHVRVHCRCHQPWL